MARYRKKPIEVEAHPVWMLVAKFKGSQQLPEWFQKAIEDGTIAFAGFAIFVMTLEGQMFATETDWIIRGIKGEIYPCKKDIFEATYDLVED